MNPRPEYNHEANESNLRAIVCPLCARPYGMALLDLEGGPKKATCPTCKTVFSGFTNERDIVTSECLVCGASLFAAEVEDLGDEEKVNIPCLRCLTTLLKYEEVIAEGGVFWRCSACGSFGAFPKDDPRAKAARLRVGIKFPEPCVIHFQAKDKACPRCSESDTAINFTNPN